MPPIPPLPTAPILSTSPTSPGSVIKIMDPVEKGAYGAVYTCKENRDTGTTMAIKCIETDTNGIPCLMEASIMSIFSHPYLNRAIRIQTTSKMLYIISDLAISDLSKWTRRDKGGHMPNPTQLRKWTHSLIQAVACLHRENIIHGDIKGSNVLLFQDGTIKLSDFTLATMKWLSAPERRHTVFTCTHRPMEVWLNREWDQEADIWALGCTLYEIAYGELLFPYQGNTKDRENSQLREKSITCLLDWAERCPSGKQRATVSRPHIDFIPFQLSALFHHERYRLFNDLILSMLRLDPNERPSAIKLLDHPYFKDGEPIPLVPYEMISTPVAKLPEKDVLALTRQLNRFTNSAAVIRLALELYARCLGIRHENDYVKLMTCLWIASKLIHRTATTSDVPTSQILSMERLICAHLSFRLHVASDPSGSPRAK
jgi:serine/threonine protein kinase